jgi:hypothetical protein
MIRTFWLATICLAVLSTLAVGKAVMIRTPSSVSEQPMDLTTLGTGPTQDTLGKADRLEILYGRQEAPTASVSQPTEPVVPAVASPPPVENKIIARHWRDPNALSSAMNQNPPNRRARARTARSSIERAIKPPVVPNLQNR